MDLTTWQRRMNEAIASLEEINFGYPLGGNQLLPPASSESLALLSADAGLDADSALLGFYRHCGGVSLPDVWNGYSVHPPELVVRTLSLSGPRRITGPHARQVVPFGSDGGGGTFLIGTGKSEEVLYVGAAAVEDVTMDGETAEVVAESFTEFLERLLEDTEAFVEDREGWTYMV